MNYPVLVLLIIVALTIFIAIKLAMTYTLSVADFKNIFYGMNDSRLINITTEGPNHVLFKYKIYPIDTIQCYDKKQNYVILKNSPALEIQFTKRDNKKTSVYFDTIRIQENIVSGSSSRYINSIQTVDLNNVVKIELRSLKKGFKYLTKDPI